MLNLVPNIYPSLTATLAILIYTAATVSLNWRNEDANGERETKDLGAFGVIKTHKEVNIRNGNNHRTLFICSLWVITS